MPIYEYECKDCGVFELILPYDKSSDPQDCPKCKREGCPRVFSAPAIQFKGSGFYCNDSWNGNKKVESKKPADSIPLAPPDDSGGT